MKTYALLALIAIVLVGLLSLQQTPVTIAQVADDPSIIISEFMASNDALLLDEDGDDSDWIELYNISDAAIDVGGRYLTDDSGDLMKWQLPSPTVIEADDYLIVFASDKDRSIAGSELHTNFKLSASGEFLGLVESDGTTIEWQYAPEYPQQFTNIAYGVDEAFVERYFTTATPGEANDATSQDLGPEVGQVSHTPSSPLANDPLQVSARITSSTTISQVNLTYRAMFGSEITVPMFDDGLHNDGFPGDNVYGSTIPANSAAAGDMLRYFVSALDVDSVEGRLPLAVNTINAPRYFGTVIVDPTIDGNLEVLHWFVEDVVSAETRDGTRASIQYRGIFYDNVFVRTRGGVTANSPKRSFKFDMNNGYWFNYDEAYALMEEIDVNSTQFDPTSMRPMLAFQAYADAGSPYSLASALRVERNGEFYSVAHFIEHPDERYLERNGLDPNGALYQFNNALQIIDQNVEKKTRKNEDTSDIQAVVDALQLNNCAREAYLLDNFNIPNLINYMAVRTTISDWDVICHNYYLHRDTEGTGEWRVVPWDKDLALSPWGGIGAALSELDHPLFGGERYQQNFTPGSSCWNRLLHAVYESPMLREMYLRRLRSVMDQLLQSPSTPVSQRYLENNINEQAALLVPDIRLDSAEWNSMVLEDALNNMLYPFLEEQRVALYQTHAVSNGGLIPAAQDGNASVEIDVVEVAPASGDVSEQYIRLYNPNAYAVDISGWTLRFDSTYEFASGVVIPAGGALYVARDVSDFRARDISPTGGQRLLVVGGLEQLPLTSHPLVLRNKSGTRIDEETIGFPRSESASDIVISEIHYKPLDEGDVDGGEYEFIELTNVSARSITLTNYQFVQGITATLPELILDAGQSAVLARNATAFAERYPNVTLAALYEGKLSNSGEELALIDADSGLIAHFAYDDTSPWPEEPDDDGNSLQRLTPTSFPEWGCSWRASAAIHGTPGTHLFAEADDCSRLYLPLAQR